jgi:hypothetical protein
MNGVINGGLYFLDGYLYSNWWVATYTRDAIDLVHNIIGYRELISYGDLGDGVARGGLSFLTGNGWLGTSYWYFATIVHLLNYYFEHFNNHI